MNKFFIENPQVWQKIDDAIITDGEFKNFVSALGLPPRSHLSLASVQNRNYLAVREWLMNTRTLDDFVRVLITMQHFSLATKLSLDARYKQLLQEPHSAATSKPTIEMSQGAGDFSTWSPRDIGRLAEEIATHWKTVCAHCNIEPEKIEVLLHSGATPLECSRKFMESLYNRCFSCSVFFSTLRKSGLIGIANKYESVGRDQRGAAPISDSMSVDSSSLLQSAALQEGARKRANPFATPKVVKTLKTFVDEDGPHYRNICVALNKNLGWNELLKIYNLLETDDTDRSAAIAKFVVDLKRQWEKRKNNPANEVLELIAETEYGSRSYKEFARDLSKIKHDPELAAAIKEWTDFVETENERRAEKNEMAFATSVALREVLLEQKICTEQDVDTLLACITAPTVGVTSLHDLVELDAADLVNAGWPVVKAKRCVNILKNLE